MFLYLLYGLFLLFLVAVFIFTGSDGRRRLVLAGAVGGGASFLARLSAPPEMSVFMQVAVFPMLVAGTWLGLTVVAAMRR